VSPPGTGRGRRRVGVALALASALAAPGVVGASPAGPAVRKPDDFLSRLVREVRAAL
jgi:hypothetical protein